MTQEKIERLTLFAGQGGRGGKGGDTVFDGGVPGSGVDISFIVEKLNRGLAEVHTSAPMVFGTGVGVDAPDGQMIFRIGSRECLRIDPEGRFFRDGNVVAEDKDVAIVLRAWLGYCCVAMGREQDRLIAAENRVAELEGLLALRKVRGDL